MSASALLRNLDIRIVDRILLVVVVLEILLGGNGYLTEIAGLRLREILFGVCMVWVLARLLVLEPVKIPLPVWLLLAGIVVLTTFSAIIGYYGGARVGAILADIKPLSYSPMLLFYMVAIRNWSDLVILARLIVICGAIVALTYLAVLGLAHTHLVEYRSIYGFLKASDEFIFRHNPEQEHFIGFLYKGAFHICPAIIFLLFDPYRWSKFLALILVVAVAMTLTRGFTAALIVALLAGAVAVRSLTRLPAIMLTAALGAAVLFFAGQAEINLLKDSGDWDRMEVTLRDSSSLKEITDLTKFGLRPTDFYRSTDIQTVLGAADIQMLAYGRGLGTTIGAREKIETTYIEILYKQGLPGLLLWAAVFGYSAYLYLMTARRDRLFALPFFLSGLFVFVVTATNTFLTGSIGMAIVWLSIAALSVFFRDRETSNEDRQFPLQSWYGDMPHRFGNSPSVTPS